MSNSPEQPAPGPEHDDMRPEYDFSQAVRGKYFERYWRTRTPIALEPDVAKDFPDSRAVNEALRKYRQLVNERRTG